MSRATELNPTSPLPHYFLGKLYVAGPLGGFLSMANSRCIDFVVPRTDDCLKLDELHHVGIRYLTRAIAADTNFVQAYALRASAFLDVKDYRQALRDFNRALELKPDHDLERLVHNDRALARMQLHQYAAAVTDLTRSIALGCDTSCNSYENRTDAYMKLGDYPRALADVGRSIEHVMESAVFLMNIESFRKLYPEYDDVADDAICERLRTLFFPNLSYADFSKKFLVETQLQPTFVLSDLYLKRGDIYARLGRMQNAEAEYDRVTRVFPKFAEGAFETRSGKRVRVQQ
jgi:tetratricopeptide (TPR) repeat protein